GGTILFAGEPSVLGDRIARVPKRAALLLAPLWRLALHAAPAPDRAGRPGVPPDHHSDRADRHTDPAGRHTDPASPDAGCHELEREVDIHAFAPADLERLADTAGFRHVEVRGEELLANWFGWFNRGLEATAAADDVPMWWRRYAFRGYLGLQRLDRRALEPRLPAALFYNLLLTARTPAAGD
ncbi:MAG: hypothetical protein KGL16_00540, partial [Acidobacteriota bacterium]|nr:hypothetical protein [Acidobacteriota bacterium]